MAEEVPGAEGNLNFEVKPTPAIVNEYKDVIQAALVATFRRGYDKYINAGDDDATVLSFVNSVLHDNNAIIAGGFLLNAIHPLTPAEYPDIDCYVPCKNLKTFNQTMVKLIVSNQLRQYNASFYCRSFLRRNGIRSVQGLYIKKIEKFLARDPRRYDGREYDRALGEYMGDEHIMDIMAVRNSRSPIDVVQNFDLTFCQVWYDGENVYATHPSHIKEKSGVLQNDYAILFLQGNRFLKKRISKYDNRGYTITFNKDMIDVSKIITNSYRDKKCIIVDKKPEYYKKWISRVFFYILFVHEYYTYHVHNHINNVVGQPEFNLNITVDDKKSNQVAVKKDIVVDQTLDIFDGYDSDDYDITVPTTYSQILNNYAPMIPNTFRPAWLALDDNKKFWSCINHMKILFFSLEEGISPFYNNIFIPIHADAAVIRRQTLILINKVYNLMSPTSTNTWFTQYAQAFSTYTEKLGDDAITLDSGVSVYDLHTHGEGDSISRSGMIQHLDTLINQQDKSALPCYLAGCTWPLTLDEIRPIVDKDYYIRFTEPIVAPLPPPSPLLGTGGLGQTLDPAGNETLDLIEIIRDEPSDAGGWRNIYHHIICPFCLGYMSRQEGCTYISHPNIENIPSAFKPYCRPQNVVQVIKGKYDAYPYLEVCAQCGRPCTDHKHFDLADPPRIAPQLLTAAGVPDYARCGGGGRREGIARIIGVRNTVIANPGMDPKELRVLAALAAEAAASDPAILATADTVLAKDRATRVEANLDGGGRLGKVCSHGYGSYKTKIKNTRKSKGKKKGTRKN